MAHKPWEDDLIYRQVAIYTYIMTSDAKLISMEGLSQAAECLKTLAHPHRLRMVQLLLRDEHTVGELANACGIPSHMASEHLGKMKDRGLLTPERRGRQIYYHVAEPHLESILGCMETRFK